MKKIIALVFPVILFTFTSCHKTKGDGPSITRDYNLTGFTSLETSIDGDVYYTQDSFYSVKIYGQSNILDLIETPVVGGELRIQFQKFSRVGRHDRLTVYVTSPEVNGLGVKGSGRLVSTNSIDGTNISLNVSGSGDLSVGSYYGESLNVTISGSGRIDVNGGEANTATTRISGSGDIDLFGLKAQHVDTHTSGSGNTKVYAEQTLDVQISGSGNVTYMGSPSLNINISGSGKVKGY